MFSQHESRNLSAYCHGELSEEESRRVAEHLIGCKPCRREFEEIKLGVKFAEQLPRVSAPASLWNEIEAALNENSRPRNSRSATPSPAVRRAPRFGWQPIAAACAVLLLALLIAGIWYSTRQPNNPSQVAGKDGQPQTTAPNQPAQDNPATAQNPSATENSTQATQSGDNGKLAEALPAKTENAATWEVARLAGTPTVGANRIEGQGRIAVGEWLVTDEQSRAKINVADIGQVDVGPNSRVRLVGTRSTEHRLALERGRLHAMISAPPRL
ncbi:MAG TPA: zf-HC2 domain-containing protein, partial [Pyrinomonadaceae bacterium]